MRTLVIGDIHANLAALAAVLTEVPYQRLLCVGDLIGYGPRPAECLDLIAAAGATVVVGNHDAALALPADPAARADSVASAAQAWDRWTMHQLEDRHRAQVLAWPATATLTCDGLTLELRHNLDGQGYVAADAPPDVFDAALRKAGTDGIAFGHSHTPFIYRQGCRFIANTGSVGQPRDGDRRASCLLIEDGRPSLMRIPYNVEATARDLERLPLPRRYRELWAEFYRTGRVDRGRLQNLERRLRADRATTTSGGTTPCHR